MVDLVIVKKVSHIKAVWKENYGITKPMLNLEFEIIKPDGDALAQENKALLNQGLQQRESDNDYSEMDRKMSPVTYNQPVDDSPSLLSSSSNLDDTVTISEHGKTIPTTVFNPRWIHLPDRLIGFSIKPMNIRVPDHGQFEPFPSTKNMNEIAS
jgi:hypothetical protein